MKKKESLLFFLRNGMDWMVWFGLALLSMNFIHWIRAVGYEFSAQPTSIQSHFHSSSIYFFKDKTNSISSSLPTQQWRQRQRNANQLNWLEWSLAALEERELITAAGGNSQFNFSSLLSIHSINFFDWIEWKGRKIDERKGRRKGKTNQFHWLRRFSRASNQLELGLLSPLGRGAPPFHQLHSCRTNSIQLNKLIVFHCLLSSFSWFHSQINAFCSIHSFHVWLICWRSLSLAEPLALQRP